jgi:hypothetical protein
MVKDGSPKKPQTIRGFFPRAAQPGVLGISRLGFFRQRGDRLILGRRFTLAYPFWP